MNHYPRRKSASSFIAAQVATFAKKLNKLFRLPSVGEEYTLEEINIESDPELLRLYRYEIPVITIDGDRGFPAPVNCGGISAKVESLRNRSADSVEFTEPSAVAPDAKGTEPQRLAGGCRTSHCD